MPKPPPDKTAGAPEIGYSGLGHPRYIALPAPSQDAISAELIGSNQASAAGIIATGHAPVLKLCRALIVAGHDPDLPLEAYRGPILCLRVSIGEGARLTVKETTRDGKPRFVTYRPGPDGGRSVGGESPVEQTEYGVAQASDRAPGAMLVGVP